MLQCYEALLYWLLVLKVRESDVSSIIYNKVLFQTGCLKYEMCHYAASQWPDFQMLFTQDYIWSALDVHSIKVNTLES